MTHNTSRCWGARFGKSAAWGVALLLLTMAGVARAASYDLYILLEPPDGSLGVVTAPTNVTDDSFTTLPVHITANTVAIKAQATGNNKFLRWEKVLGDASVSFVNQNNPNATLVYSSTNDVFIKAVFQIGVLVTSTNATGTIGFPDPPSGVNYYNPGDTETFSVTSPYPSPADPVNVRSVVEGWEGTGSIPSGMGYTTPQLIITNGSSIRWLWHDEYTLTIEIDGQGAVTRSPNKTWYTNNEVVTLVAYPLAGNYFLGWDDGILTTTNAVPMTGAKRIKAVFGTTALDQDLDQLPDAWERRYGLNPMDDKDEHGTYGDADNDGVPNITEYMISYVMATGGVAQVEASPINADSDGDGMDDGYEFFHIGASTNLTPGDSRNAIAVVSTNGVYGRNGNMDQDFKWNWNTGYKTPVGLVNIEEYVGPDSVVPGVWTTAVTVAGIPNVFRFQPNTADTGDQSFSDTTDSEIVGGSITGDGFDDGYEFTWDSWQAIHGGDPVGDPMNHFVPYRLQNAAWPVSCALVGINGSNCLAVANAGHDSVSLLYAAPGGLFYPPQPLDEWTVGKFPVCVINANMSSGADLVTANLGTNTISVLMRVGTTYNVTNFTADWGPSCVAAGDFDADGFTDVAATTTNGNLMVFMGDGLGGLTLNQTVPLGAGTRPAYVAAGIIRGPAVDDGPGGSVFIGELDLIVCNEGNDTIAIVTNDGAGTFTVSSTIPTGAGTAPKAIIIDEFDEDGTNDIAWVEYGANNERSMHGRGDATFTAPGYTTPLAAGAGSRHLASGNFDDLYPTPNAYRDVAVVNELNDSVSILLGARTDASFVQGWTVDVGDNPMWIAVADLNGDGGDDFVVVNRDTDTAYVFFSNRDGSFRLGGSFDTSARVADRRYNPAEIHNLPPDFGRPDYDVRYDPIGGGSGKWLTDEDEYNAWKLPFTEQQAVALPGGSGVVMVAGSLLRPEYPDVPRCSHPFFWDIDRDEMPDGWEMAFSYDPWDADTDNNGIRDDAENPDGDWYAQDELLPLTKHFDVYLLPKYGYENGRPLTGYSPYTGYGYLGRFVPMDEGYGPAGPDTSPMDNYNELVGDRGMAAITEDDPDDRASHPLKIDSDGDGIWDGWEFFVGMNPKNILDGGLDYDMDGLSNTEEFQSWATSTNIQAARTYLPNWQNKLRPTDPLWPDTDGDQIGDGGEMGAFNFTQGAGENHAILDEFTGEIVYEWFTGGGLNPCTADTDVDYMPDAWESYYPGFGTTEQDANGIWVMTSWSNGMNGTVDDMYDDYDFDGLQSYQEYFAGAVYHWQFWYTGGGAAWTPGRGWLGYEPWDFFDPTMSAGGYWYVGPGGRGPMEWDPNYYSMPLLGKEWKYMTMCQALICAQRWSTCDPGNWDTDLDGMDDYYETFHNLNPLFGIYDVVATKVYHIPPIYTWTILPHIIWQNSRDIRLYPWIAGHPELDSDQDELQNWEEALSPTTFIPERTEPPNYHTDPSPHWVGDTSYSESWANLYYWLGMIFGYHGTCFGGMNWWYWDAAVLANFDAAPTYAYSFECNEGFDTDNDALADRGELVDQTVGPGATDALESQSPIKRRAMYFNGNAATRTRVPHSHDPLELRMFTVELWARPTKPVGNQEQVMVEKGAYVDQGNILNWPAALRLNFKVGLDTSGRPFGGYHSAERAVQFVEVTADPRGTCTSNQWYHCALVYDGEYQADGHFVGLLRLYVDGELAGARPSSLIPFNGWVGLNATGVVNYGYYYPMPVVMGAGDNNPAGTVDGGTDIGNYFPVGPLYCSGFGQPQLHSFYRGWLDELLVWHGGRTREELRSTMRHRWRRSELLNAKLFQFPALIMAFTFDDVQDPDHGTTTPYGFANITGWPVTLSGLPWWARANDRSLVYNNYKYVPWLENQAVHNPLDPPWDTTKSSSGGLSFPNTANPYGFFYETATGSLGERHPRASSGSFVDDAANHLADMLPLRWVVADEDVVMWDNDTKGTDPFDTDGDGLPDGWEEQYGFDPLDPVEAGLDPDNDGISNLYEYYIGTSPHARNSDGDDLQDEEEDADGDRLVNLTEFTLQTMPNMKDTDDDGISDWEEVTGSKDPAFAVTRPATSKDPAGITDPLSSLSPPLQRCLYFNGYSRMIIPPNNKLMAPSWTVETWVKPATNNNGGVLISRYVTGTLPAAFGINYEIGLSTYSATTNRPYARYRSIDGQEVRVDGTQPTDITAGLAPILIPKDRWSHIAATYDQTTLTFSLYVNGRLAAYRSDATPVPATVAGYKTDHWGDEVTAGASRTSGPITQGFIGWMDEIRIWRGARTADEIFDRYNAPEGVPSDFSNNTIRYRNLVTTPVAGDTSSLAGLSSSERVHMIVQADSSDVAATFAAVQQAGGTMSGYVSTNARVVVMSPAQLETVKDRIRWAGLLDPKAKIARSLRCDGTHAERTVLVHFFDDVAAAKAAAAVTSVGASVRGGGYVAGTYMMADANDDQVRAIAAKEGVLRVMKAPADMVAGRTMRLCKQCAKIGGLKALPYELVGEGWDGPGLGSANLTYHFINTTPDLAPDACKKAMADQLGKWASYAALYFSETMSPGLDYSHDMGFGIDPAGAFDGPFGVLAYGYFPNDINPEPVAGDCYYDEDEDWTIAGNGIDLRYVSLHEFGHCLGLGHSDDPTAVMFPFYNGSAADPVLQQDDIDGIQALYGSAVGMGRAEFRFDDGGLEAEDFAEPQNWLKNWSHSAMLEGAVFSLSSPPLDRDTDGDGMPDWWEIGAGLDPYDPTGINGAYGDPDLDELDNIYEYYAGTNPMMPDTDRDGFSDYDSGLNPTNGNGRTNGERYDDGDRIPDTWELLYMNPAPNTGRRGLDPAYYDAHLDPDEDGWSSYAEYMGSYIDPATGVAGRGANPTSPTNYPTPIITVRLRYNGLLGDTIEQALGAAGQVVLNFYKTRHMDGVPAATLAVLAADLNQGAFTEFAMDAGHLVEGTNFVFAFIDVNGNGAWDPAAEPAGIADPQPVIGWGNVNNVEVGLFDREKRSGYPRFTWPVIAGADGYYVRLARISAPADTNIFTRFIAGADRNYVHEGDYVAAGRYGVFGTNVAGSTYVLYINYEGNIDGHKVILPHPTTPAPYRLVDQVTLSTPTFVTQNDTVYQYAMNEIQWSMVAGATSYRLEISRTTNGAALAGIVAMAPYRTLSGTYAADLPFFAGDRYDGANSFTNGRYFVRVRAEIPGTATSVFASAWAHVAVNLGLKTPPNGGKSMISGDVYYFGKTARGYGAGLTNDLRIVVQTLTSAGFSGKPDGQVEFSYVCNTNKPSGKKGSYNLLGLHGGAHYVRAFLDLNGNKNLDLFEPFGFAQIYQDAFNYAPRLVDLGTEGNVIAANIRIVIRDRDTDDDGLPDGWEYTMLGGTLAYGAHDDPDGDGADNLLEYEDTWTDSDPMSVDTDGDGVNDGDEIRLGLLTHVADTDGDGLSDGVELALGLDPFDPDGDADDDTMSDAVEVKRSYTNPNDARDVLGVVSMAEAPAGAVFMMTWDGKAGVQYKVQMSYNLNTWLDVPGAVYVGAGKTLSFTERNPAVDGQVRYYRIVIP